MEVEFARRLNGSFMAVSIRAEVMTGSDIKLRCSTFNPHSQLEFM